MLARERRFCTMQSPASEGAGTAGNGGDAVTDTEPTDGRKAELREAWADRSLSELADHIETDLHARMRSFIARIVDEIDAVLAEVGNDDPDRPTLFLANLRSMLTEDLERHAREEEEVLFPHIRALEKGESGKLMLHSMGRIQDEHDQIADTLVRLMVDTALDRLPVSLRERTEALVANLETFRADLREHVFLEEELLFAGAVELERRRDGAADD